MVSEPLPANPTVLVVEDEPFVRFVARDILEDAGFEVIEVAEAAEALDVLRARTGIVLLFTDIHMPGPLDGLELARRVASGWPKIKLALTSGRARPREDEMPAGALFVPKPYHPSLLARQLRRLVEG